MTEDRLMDLEMKYAHQERAIEQLEKTTFDQHRLIQDLEKRIERLSEKYDALTAPDAAAGDQKPPHY